MRLVIGTTYDFAGGSIYWESVQPTLSNFSHVEINVHQRYSWINSFSSCNPGGGGQPGTLTHTFGSVPCTTVATITVSEKCTTYDTNFKLSVTESILTGSCTADVEMILVHQNDHWLSTINSTSTSKNNRLVTMIDLKVRSASGKINSSPVTNMPPIINIPINTPQIIRIPMIDADGDIVKCRWANQSTPYYFANVDECGDACGRPSNSQLYTTSNSDNNCTLLINITSNTNYAIVIQIEDFLPAAPYHPLSSIPLQFVVHGIDNLIDLPSIIGEYINGAIITVSANTSFSALIIARMSNLTNNKIIKFTEDIAPLGITSTSNAIQRDSTTYSAIFTWIPTVDQIGTKQLYCTVAIDYNNRQSTQYCLNFIVVKKTDSSPKSESADISLLLGLSLGLGVPLLLLIAFTTFKFLKPKSSSRKIGQQKLQDKKSLKTVSTTTIQYPHCSHQKQNTRFVRPKSACSEEFQSNSMNMTRTTFASSVTKSLAPIDYASTFNSYCGSRSQRDGNSKLAQTYFGQGSLENSRVSNWHD